jgi:hypothetical protein
VPLHPFPARLAAILAVLLSTVVLLGCGATRSDADAQPAPDTVTVEPLSTDADDPDPTSATVVGPDNEVLAETGQYVAFICFDADGVLVHQEARYHDPADPLASLDR